MAKRICVICGKEKGFFGGYKIRDGSYLCFDCEEPIVTRSNINKILGSYISKLNASQVRELYNNTSLTIQDFISTSETDSLIKEKLEKGIKCANCGMVCKDWFDKYNLADGSTICSTCREAIMKRSARDKELISSISDLTIKEFSQLYYDKALSLKHFLHDKQEICGVIFDDTVKTIDFSFTSDLKAYLAEEEYIPVPIPYASIVKYEYKEGEKTVSTGGSGLGRAVVGGLLFCGAGAIVGATTKKQSYNNVVMNMSVRITFNINGEIYIKKIKINGIFNGSIEYGTSVYLEHLKKAENLMAKLDNIYFMYHKEETGKNQNQSVNTVPTQSNADEIRKYKELLDDGIISTEEFEQKKKQLLGL